MLLIPQNSCKLKYKYLLKLNKNSLAFLFTSNNQNYVVLTSRYQFGLVSFKQSSSYLIQQENNHFSAKELNHQKGFMIGGGF